MAWPTKGTLDDKLGGARRFVTALGKDPSEWDAEYLPKLDELEQLVRDIRATVIYGMREQGTTDKQIAQALGITQQAVSKRWPGGGRYVGAAGRYRKTTTTTGDAS
jgi:FixJ family two-component response regulator